jgi:hypothetical protein
MLSSPVHSKHRIRVTAGLRSQSCMSMRSKSAGCVQFNMTNT